MFLWTLTSIDSFQPSDKLLTSESNLTILFFLVWFSFTTFQKQPNGRKHQFSWLTVFSGIGFVLMEGSVPTLFEGSERSTTVTFQQSEWYAWVPDGDGHGNGFSDSSVIGWRYILWGVLLVMELRKRKDNAALLQKFPSYKSDFASMECTWRIIIHRGPGCVTDLDFTSHDTVTWPLGCGPVIQWCLECWW